MDLSCFKELREEILKLLQEESSPPPIKLIILLLRLNLSFSLLTKKWINKLQFHFKSLPSIERKSFQIEFSSPFDTILQTSQQSSLQFLTSLPFPLKLFPIQNNFISFSSSNIWKIQNNFYQSAKLTAWNSVPYEISNNNYISSLYFQQIDQYLATSPLNPRICIIEVGSGQAILSLLLARELKKVIIFNRVYSSSFISEKHDWKYGYFN